MRYRVRHQRLAGVVVATSVFYVLTLLPSGAVAHETTDLPDPPSHPMVMPGELQRIQPHGSLQSVQNHVRKLTDSQLAGLAEAGATVIINEEGLVTFDIVDHGRLTHLALYDTRTKSGTAVIGLGFAADDATTAASTPDRGFLGLGPQVASANTRAQDHTHSLGPPFHDGCSYLFQYGGGEDAYVYICSTDVGNIRAVGGLAATAIGIATGFPLLGWLGGLVWNVGIGFFQNSSGAIRIDIPGTSAVNHYGSAYYYTGSRYGWYYFYRYTSAYYGYALRSATGVLYYVRI
jgi:hypothetical protein